MEKTVSFIIPARNEEKFLATTLKSIQRQSPSIDFEMIVVDNESTDGTRAIAESLGAKVVTTKPGFAGRARNVGAAHARGRVLAFVDADCELPPHWLDTCLRQLDVSGVVAVGSIQARPEPSTSWVEHVWCKATSPGSAAQVFVHWLPTFNLVVRRSDFENLAGFNESLQSCEDSDFSFRLSSHGRLLLDTTAPVIHHGMSRSLREFWRREAWRSRGNIKSLRMRKLQLSELPSIMIPLAYCGLLLLAMACITLWATQVISWHWAAASSAAAVFAPLAIAIRRPNAARSMVEMCEAWFVFAVYLTARGVGTVMPNKRLSR